MSFQDLSEYLDDTLTLPIKGKTYTVPSPDAKTGLYVEATATLAVQVQAGLDVSADDVASLQLGDADEKHLYERVLGPAYAQMVADEVPWVWVKHAGATAYLWIAQDKAAAEAHWNSLAPKAPKAPQDRKKKAKKSARPVSPGSSTPQPTPADATPGGTSSRTGA